MKTYFHAVSFVMLAVDFAVGAFVPNSKVSISQPSHRLMMAKGPVEEKSFWGPTAAAIAGWTIASQIAGAALLPVSSSQDFTQGNLAIQEQPTTLVALFGSKTEDAVDFSFPSYDFSTSDADTKKVAPPKFNPFGDSKPEAVVEQTKVAPSMPELKLPEFKKPDFPEFKAPDVSLPEFKKPDIKLPEFKKPDMPQFSMPKFDMPKFDMPKMDMPDTSDTKLPKFEAPAMPEFKKPDIKMPEFKMPDMKLPKFEAPDMPEFKKPDFKAPDISIPKFEAPDMPEFKKPDIKLPDMPEFKKPDIKMPEFNMPKMPEFKKPDFKLPEVKAPTLPKVDMPDYDLDIPKVNAPSMPKFDAPSMPKIALPSLPNPFGGSSSSQAEEVLEPQEVRDERAREARGVFLSYDSDAKDIEARAREARNLANEKKKIANAAKDEACQTRPGGKWICLRNPFSAGF